MDDLVDLLWDITPEVTTSESMCNTAINFCMFIKKIADRGYFCTYYVKEELLEDCEHLVDSSLGPCREKFIFLMKEDRNEKGIPKDDVLKLLEETDAITILELCFTYFFNYSRKEIKEYEDYTSDKKLFEKTSQIVSCFISLERIKSSNLELLLVKMKDFVSFLIHTVATMNLSNWTSNKSTLYIFITSLILLFKNIKEVQEEIFNNIRIKINSLNQYLVKFKKTEITGLEMEVFASFLQILTEIMPLRARTALNLTEQAENDEFCNSLLNIVQILPDYMAKPLRDILSIYANFEILG